MAGFKLTLKKPIDSHGKQITEINFKEPEGQHCFTLGMPFTTIMQPEDEEKGISARIELKDNPQVLYKWCAALADVPGDVLVAMTAGDVRKVYGWLTNELNPQDVEDPVKN
jgi:hypothetical protein